MSVLSQQLRDFHYLMGGTPETLASIEKFELEERIRGHGFELVYQDYCECADTPGFLGQIAGVTDRDKRLVRISTVVNDTSEKMLAILRHELRHIEQPDWDCGNRDVLGRGGPRNG